MAQPTPQDACIHNAYPDETVCYPTDDWGTRTRSESAPGARLVATRLPGVERLDPINPPRDTVSFADFYDPERRHARLLLVMIVGSYDPVWADDDVLAVAEQGVRIVKVFTTSVPATETAHLSVAEASKADLAAFGVADPYTTETLFVDPRSMELLARVYDDPLGAIQPWLKWSAENPPRETGGAPKSWTSPPCAGKCMAPPFGWRFITRVPTGSSCPNGSEGPTPIVTSAAGAAATCTCSCDPTPVVPAQNCSTPAFVDMVVWQDAACKTSGLNSYFGVNGCIQNTASYAYSSATELGAYAYVGAYPTTHAVCASPVTTENVPAPTSTNAGTECNPTTLFDACGADSVCMPPKNTFYQCIERDGDHPCPTDYSFKDLAGDGYTDTRSCTQCICGASERCGGTVTVYSDTSCSNETLSLTLADFTCHGLGTNQLTPGSLKLSALVPQATCGIVSTYPQPWGSVELSHPRTICCNAW